MAVKLGKTQGFGLPGYTWRDLFSQYFLNPHCFLSFFYLYRQMSDMNYTNKVVVITGATSGIGEACGGTRHHPAMAGRNLSGAHAAIRWA